MMRRIGVATSILLALVGMPSAQAGDRSGILLKNWGGFVVARDAAYDDLERLIVGLADRTILNTKPLSRIEAARSDIWVGKWTYLIDFGTSIPSSRPTS